MGLLDTKAMKFLFGDSAYMKRQRADETANRVKGIIGQVGGSVGNGPMQPQGLLGQNPTPEQFSTQLGQQLMGVPGYEDEGVNLMNQMTSNRQSGANNMNTVQGAWDRQLQGQDFSMNNLTADQGRQQSNTDRAFFQGQNNKDRDYFTKQMQQSNQILEIGNQVWDTLPKMDNGMVDASKMTASQDNQMIMGYAKAMTPGEAVGVDEKGAILASAWMPPILRDAIAGLSGGSSLSDTMRRQILDQYSQILKQNQVKNEQLKTMNTRSNVRYGADPSMQPYSPPRGRYNTVPAREKMYDTSNMSPEEARLNGRYPGMSPVGGR